MSTEGTLKGLIIVDDPQHKKTLTEKDRLAARDWYERTLVSRQSK